MSGRGASIAEIERSHPPFITVARYASGWRPVMVVWNDDGGFSSVEQIGIPYDEKSDAVIGAQEWARAEALEYRP